MKISATLFIIVLYNTLFATINLRFSPPPVKDILGTIISTDSNGGIDSLKILISKGQEHYNINRKKNSSSINYSEIKVYPNISNGENFNVAYDEGFNVNIYNVLGQRVGTLNTTKEISLTKNIYFLEFTNKSTGDVKIKKIIAQSSRLYNFNVQKLKVSPEKKEEEKDYSNYQLAIYNQEGVMPLKQTLYPETENIINLENSYSRELNLLSYTDDDFLFDDVYYLAYFSQTGNEYFVKLDRNNNKVKVPINGGGIIINSSNEFSYKLKSIDKFGVYSSFEDCLKLDIGIYSAELESVDKLVSNKSIKKVDNKFDVAILVQHDFDTNNHNSLSNIKDNLNQLNLDVFGIDKDRFSIEDNTIVDNLYESDNEFILANNEDFSLIIEKYKENDRSLVIIDYTDNNLNYEPIIDENTIKVSYFKIGEDFSYTDFLREFVKSTTNFNLDFIEFSYELDNSLKNTFKFAYKLPNGLKLHDQFYLPEKIDGKSGYFSFKYYNEFKELIDVEYLPEKSESLLVE